MLTLQIILGVLGVSIICYLLFISFRKIFRIYWMNFKFDIFSKKIFIIEAIIGILFLFGISIAEATIDKWNGYILCILSAFVFIGLLFHIYKKTNFKYMLLAIPIIGIVLPFLAIIALFVILRRLLSIFGIDVDEYIIAKRYY